MDLLIVLFSGDSLYKSMHNNTTNGMKFSTYDRDNDISTYNCADVFSGAWWYTDCHFSNLNGKYLGGYHKSAADRIEWYTWKGHHYSLKTVKMTFRKYWSKQLGHIICIFFNGANMLKHKSLWENNFFLILFINKMPHHLLQNWLVIQAIYEDVQ